MPHSRKPEETHYPDDIQLKNEIDEISSRINRIMDTVKVHFPMSRCGRTESELDEAIEETRDLTPFNGHMNFEAPSRRHNGIDKK